MYKQSFNNDWRFNLGDPGGPRWSEPDTSTWRSLDLPHDWSIELDRSADEISADSGGYFPMGHGWYVKTFNLPDEFRGKKIFIEFEGIYMNAHIWLNQNLLGRHPYGYTSFHYDLTPHLDWEGKNTLKVFVDNTHQKNSRWYSGSGIYRPVWLIAADPVHVAHWGIYITTQGLSSNSARVQVQTQVENQSNQDQEVELRSQVISPAGEPAGESRSQQRLVKGSQFTFDQEISVKEPQHWSPDEPHLYQLHTEVRVDGQMRDTEITTFGIRTIEFSAEEGFRLNGEPLLIKGGCVHHDNGVLGAAVYARSEERKVEVHKESGYNAIRCAHNPPSPAFLDACDRLGMLVMDEAFDCWREGKNIGDYHVAFEDWWQRDVQSMLYRDRNHPSIIMWSIGNEVLERDGRGGGVKIARMLADQIRAIDPTRPVTAAINGSWSGGTWGQMDGVFAELDVGGYNYQWENYLPDHERLPERIMVGTESFPIQALENWVAVRDNSFVIGDFVWTSLDYLGESGIGRVHFDGEQAPFLGGYPWHQANCGDIDLCGFKRPQSYYKDMLWHDDPRLYIAVHTPTPEGKTATITRWGWPDVWPNWNWPEQDESTLQVDVYSNCEQVELFLNGQSLGSQPSDEQARYTASFEVAYASGELRAVGYRSGKAVAETSIKTAGNPTKILLNPDRPKIQAAPADLCYVTVDVTDSDENRHPTAQNEIFFSLEGPGEILAVGSSNPVSTERYVGNQRRVFRGRALVVVKSTGQSGKVILRAQADGLEPAETTIDIE